MMKIELNKTGANSLEKRYFKNKSFSHVTGNQIKLLPFKTNPSGDTFSDDFKSFQGIIGELFRIFNSKTQIELNQTNGSFKIELKDIILANAIDKVDTESVEEFKNMLSKLFFDEEHGLIKFNIQTLSYMNFINTNNAIKEISKFIFDLFLTDDFDQNNFNEDLSNENLLHQLILQCLPKLPDSTYKQKDLTYNNLFPELKTQFLEDFAFLKTSNSYFLKHVEDFFKYYYFHYLSQLILRINDFGTTTRSLKPVYYTMDWETLSETRLSGHVIGWKQLNKYSESIFAHVNTLELLNYIYVNGVPIGDYQKIMLLYIELDSDEKEKLKDCLKELINFYTENITVFDTGKNWDDCDRILELDLINKNFEFEILRDIYSLWFKIKYQFENSSRKKPYSDYSKWYSQFGKINYTKNRGRLGNTTILSQELLLFLTRICIGNEDKIRLKALWGKFKDRGIVFDETTKLEITKLFEKINLIEKKSDSGDAQYVKSTI
ncbi:DNA phosphorothioation-dependent restriction protein DptG [Flavobacterium cheongpyeongense]|uniref:DNA phosphorothioation-dependent restriction protein DptG n=1 Tax=Flavobacterium cheongpyeongense TaxID=2212651 RepID=A0A2V4BRY5_9FLAO|nr:DNA phosphorothioation-dependent restriction protein DptG [Flavobacterium cheongpyeongense]PXY40603.1 DNA phosphorothioation-dependent restriction protein DptG [Flavobacterium cheongpyeongense]